LDENVNALKHVFINFIFIKLEFCVWHSCLCTRPGDPTWGTRTPGGTFAYPKGYI